MNTDEHRRTPTNPNDGSMTRDERLTNAVRTMKWRYSFSFLLRAMQQPESKTRTEVDGGKVHAGRCVVKRKEVE